MASRGSSKCSALARALCLGTVARSGGAAKGDRFLFFSKKTGKGSNLSVVFLGGEEVLLFEFFRHLKRSCIIKIVCVFGCHLYSRFKCTIVRGDAGFQRRNPTDYTRLQPRLRPSR